MKTTTILLATLALAGCSNAPPTNLIEKQLPPSNQSTRNNSDDPTKDPGEKQGGYNGGQNNTFDHDSDLGAYGGRNPFDILKERQAEGAPEVRTRLHSCQKLPIATLTTLLGSFGVDLGNTDKNSAGGVLAGGRSALGAADYDSRVAEATTWSAAGAAKTFDIFMQAAPEIISKFSTLAVCKQDNGKQPDLFDSDNQCNADALSCLMGKPARQAHVDICNAAVAQGSTVDSGKAIAVATILSAAHSCE